MFYRIFIYTHRRMAITADDVSLEHIIPISLDFAVVEGEPSLCVWPHLFVAHKHFNVFSPHVLVSSPEELAVVGESHSFPLWIHFPLQYSTQRSLAGIVYIPLISCVNLSSVGGDTRIRISYQEEELELKLPFGSHTRLFLSEVNRAWSGMSENTF